MNAPARIPSRERSAYYPQIDTFMPGCEEEERELRASLMLMRDNATAALKWSAPDACDLLEVVQRQCTVNCFTVMSVDDLREFRAIMVRTLTCASSLHTLAISGGPDGNA